MSGFFVIDSKDKRAEAAQFVASLPASPLYSVEVKPYKRAPSLAHNRTMWMLYGVIADYMGCTAEDLHEQMKVTVLGVERKVVAGQALILPRSTTDLDVQGMCGVMDDIEALARDLGVVLPNTDGYDYAKNGRKAA